MKKISCKAFKKINQSFCCLSPAEDYNNKEENGAVNGEVVKPCDIIKITGQPENCQAAKEALEKLVPVTVEVIKNLHLGTLLRLNCL